MPEPHPVELFIPEIRQLIAEKNLDELKFLLSEIHPIDLAEGFHNFSSEHQLLLFKLLKSDRMVEVFEELDVPEQEYLTQHLEDLTLSPLLEGTPPEVTAKFFKKLPQITVKKLEKLMKKERFEIVRHQLEYPSNSAGSRMRTNVIGINPDLSARATLEHLQRSTRVNKEEKLDPLFVTNGGGKLMGWLTLQTLISAPQDIKIKDIMSPVSLIKISAKMDQEEAAKIFSKYKLISAPVVDDENKLVGILNVDDMLDVIQEEATEDIAKLAGTKAEELETGSFLRVSRLRMPWLMASYLGGIIASFIVGSFEGLLAQMAPLITFIPVIAGMGGNVGTQSSTIVVRGLATGRIQIGEIARILQREFLVGLTLGFSYGLCLGGIAYYQFRNTYSLKMPFVVGIGILTSMTVAATMGTLTPLFFKKFDIDPAAVSAPFVSTTTDIVSISVYLLLGSYFLM